MTIRIRAMWVFTLVLCLGLTQIAVASVPLKGRGSAQVTDVNGNVLTAVGSGNATHLGAFRRVEHIVLGPDGAISGDITFTAANGDQLTANFVGGFTSDTTASGTYTITGGTGRFANATGTAFFLVSLTGPASFNFEFNGAIEK